MSEQQSSANKRFSEYFGKSSDSIEVEYSRYRFALEGRPDQVRLWDAIRREYRQIQAAREGASGRDD